MNLPRYQILCLATLSALMLIAPACHNDDEPSSSIPLDAVYSIVTYVGTDKSGSSFEMQKFEDSPIITYTSTVDLAATKKVSVGDRLIISYDRQGADVYSSGPISLYGFAGMSNSQKQVLVGEAADYEDWATQPFDMEALWRSGHYLNMQTRILGYKAIAPEKFVLVVDSLTIEDPYPQMHLMYTQKKDNVGANRYMVYGSFDLSPVWESESCLGVVVNYPDKDGNKSIVFKKN